MKRTVSTGRVHTGVVKLALAAVCAVAALAGAQPAAAYPGDALHQYGWSYELRNMRNVFWCMDNIPSMGQSGSISHLMPDVMTTPGGRQTVYFTARLEYWDGYKPVTIDTAPQPWWYTTATSSGIAYQWRELGTDRSAPNPFYWTSAWSDTWFRIHYYFYWGYDRTQAYDATSDWCQI